MKSQERDYIYRRFGPVVAKRVFVANCALFFLSLIVLLGLTANYLILSDDTGFAILSWVGAILACVAMLILRRIYKSGIAEISRYR